MSARVYRDDLRCPHCGSNHTPKDGHSRGKQTYRCGQCHYRFTPDGNRHYYPEAVKTQAVTMYVEGMCVLAIGRTLGVKPLRIPRVRRDLTEPERRHIRSHVKEQTAAKIVTSEPG